MRYHLKPTVQRTAARRDRKGAALYKTKLFLTGALYASLLPAQEQAPNRILRPTNGAVLTGKIEGIAKVANSGSVFLDGALLATKEKAPGVLTFLIEAPSGPHSLESKYEGGAEKLTFTSGKSETPFRLHPPAAACETCHTVRDSIWGFKNDVLETTCSGCHNLKDFATRHQHNREQLADCAMCHNPHGSSEAFHMKYPRKIACKQCHG